MKNKNEKMSKVPNAFESGVIFKLTRKKCSISENKNKKKKEKMSKVPNAFNQVVMTGNDTQMSRLKIKIK